MCIGLGFLYTQSGQYYITLPHIDISDWHIWLPIDYKHTTNLHVHHHKIYNAFDIDDSGTWYKYIHVECPTWDSENIYLNWQFENFNEDDCWLNRSTYKHHIKQIKTIAKHIITENKAKLENLEKQLVIANIQIGSVYAHNADYLHCTLKNINNKFREIDKISSEEELTLSKEQYLHCVEQYKEDINIYTTICCERMKQIVNNLIEAVNALHIEFNNTLGNNYKVERFYHYHNSESWTKYLIEQLIDSKNILIRSIYLPDEVPF